MAFLSWVRSVPNWDSSEALAYYLFHSSSSSSSQITAAHIPTESDLIRYRTNCFYSEDLLIEMNSCTLRYLAPPAPVSAMTTYIFHRNDVVVLFCPLYQYSSARWNHHLEAWRSVKHCGIEKGMRAVLVFTKFDIFTQRFRQQLVLPDDYTGTRAHPEECAMGIAMYFLCRSADLFKNHQQHAIITNLTDLRYFDQLVTSIQYPPPSKKETQQQQFVEMLVCMQWRLVRLLLLAHKHNRSNPHCHLAKLPFDIIKAIAKMI